MDIHPAILGPVFVVVIDDERPIRELLSVALKRIGLVVISFDDAGIALTTIDFKSVDLLMTDLSMPTRGENLIHEIRSNGCTLPIIVLSGNLETGDEETLRVLGVDRVLQKPFKLNQVVEEVRELLPV